MFESANQDELAKIVRNVITPEVAAEGKAWVLTDQVRHQIYQAMFGPGRPGGSMGAISAAEQQASLSQFSDRIAGPIIGALPPDKAARGVLMLYEVFVDAVFIQPVQGPDLGSGG